MKEVGLLGPGFAAVDCCAVVADELQAEFIYEHVEGAKVVAGTGVRSVGIHDDVGVVGGPDEKLHEEPARPAVVSSRLVRACDLVILVDGSHVPETRGNVRVPGDRTFMQNCVKRSRGLIEFLGVVLAAWHEGGQDSQLVLQEEEERDGVVKAVHEQHVVLVGDLRIIHETADNTTS